MAFPADVKLVSVTCGTGYDFSGEPITITLEVTPVLGGSLKRLIHAATGTFMTRDALTFKSDPGSPATFTVPSPAQADTWKDGSGAFFTNWSYSVTVTTRTASGKTQSWIQSFQPVDGQETVDLDLVPDGQIGSPTSAPAPAVTSVNGQSGAVVIDVGEAVTPESVAANLTVEAVDAKLPERLSESALSAAIDDPLRKGLPAASKSPRALVAFSFDDGYMADKTAIAPMLDARGIKGTFGIVTDNIGDGLRMSWDDVRNLAAGGHEIASHSKTHAHLTAVSTADLDAEVNGSADALMANGIPLGGFIWPYNEHNAATRAKVREAYTYAIGNTDAVGTTQPLYTYALGRYALSNTTVVADATARITAAIAANEFLIFYAHPNDLNATGLERLGQIMDFAKASTATVATVGEGFRMVGNVIDAGDLPSGAGYTVLDGSGRLYSPTLPRVSPPSSVTPATAPNSYAAGVLTYSHVSAAANSGEHAWPVSNMAVNIITDRTGTASLAYTTQQMIEPSGQAWTRRANTDNTWGAWTNPAIDIITAPSSVTAATLPDAFSTGKITHSAISTASNTDWPVTGVAATIKTDCTFKGSSRAYVSQTFTPSTNAAIYQRFSNTTNTWGAWKSTTLV